MNKNTTKINEKPPTKWNNNLIRAPTQYLCMIPSTSTTWIISIHATQNTKSQHLSKYWIYITPLKISTHIASSFTTVKSNIGSCCRPPLLLRLETGTARLCNMYCCSKTPSSGTGWFPSFTRAYGNNRHCPRSRPIRIVEHLFKQNIASIYERVVWRLVLLVQ